MNQQKPTRGFKSATHLNVHSIFFTFQGEGPFSGRPALFIRLAGCNLQCPQCDTQYTGGLGEMTAKEIEQYAIGLPNAHDAIFDFIVVTGGEPLAQNLQILTTHFHGTFGSEIQLETNGTLPLAEEVAKYVHVVCSPKTRTVHPSLFLAQSFCFKYVVSSGNTDKDNGDLPIRALGNNCEVYKPVSPRNKFPIYITPVDEHSTVANARNKSEAMRVAMKRGYVLQVQLHKIYGAE